MMIFTPGAQFDSGTVRQVMLHKPAHMPGMGTPSRARVVVNETFLFTGDEALSVIDQLHAAGYYTDEQHAQVRSLLLSYQLADDLTRRATTDEG